MVRWIKGVLFSVVALALLGILGQNFSFAPSPSSAKSAKRVPKPLPQEPDESVEPANETRKYVKIDGQIFPYNPRHIYVVNGVPTYYVNNGKAQPSAPPETDQSQDSADGTALGKLQGMVRKNPLSAYSPEGLKTVVKGAFEARDQADKRAKALDELAR